MQRRLSWSCGFIVVLGVIFSVYLHKGSPVQGEIADEEQLDPETRVRIITAAKSLLGGNKSEQHEGSDICSDLQWVEDVHDATKWFLPGINGGVAIQWAEAGIDPAAAKAKFSAVSLKAANTLMSMLTQRELQGVRQQAHSCRDMDASDRAEVLSRLIRVLFFTELLELHWSETQ